MTFCNSLNVYAMVPQPVLPGERGIFASGSYQANEVYRTTTAGTPKMKKSGWGMRKALEARKGYIMQTGSFQLQYDFQICLDLLHGSIGEVADDRTDQGLVAGQNVVTGGVANLTQ